MQEDISVWSRVREAGRDKAALEPDPPELRTVLRTRNTVQLIPMEREGAASSEWVEDVRSQYTSTVVVLMRLP